MPAVSELDRRMARPREFDEEVVLDAAVQCFWSQGYESTSVKDLMERTGLTAASLYNAYGDKRAMFRIALDHPVPEYRRENSKRVLNARTNDRGSGFLEANSY